MVISEDIKTKAQGVAYCGLYCPECYILASNLAGQAGDLAAIIRGVDYKRLIQGLAELDPEFAGLANIESCLTCLDSLGSLACSGWCRAGGGSSYCSIRECCKYKDMEGCWECHKFEVCERLQYISPVNHDHHIQNIRIIRRKGMEAFLAGPKGF